ncbi:MAG: pilus assembly protein TadG-related protein [Roseiflexaceae bacterium]
MNARLFRAKGQGQSIPIIALILVVLFAMVGLSVDVGNTYAQNRNAVRSTNAAVLAGMDLLIHSGSNPSDVEIGMAIKASFKSNGITAQIDPTVAVVSGERRILSYYLDSYGNPLGNSCTIGKCGSVPANVAYIQVDTTGTVDTYFARVVGQQTLPVKAQAFAGQCTPVKGVYPIAVNAANIDSTKGVFYPPTGPDAADEIKYYGKYYDEIYGSGLTQRRIYRKSDFSQPGNFDWLKWSSSASAGNAGATEEMLAEDGNLELGFDEVVMSPRIRSSTGTQYATGWPDPNSAEVPGYPLFPHQLSEGDWIYANTGNNGSNAVKAALDYHIANRTVLNLPIVDRVIGPGGANTYMHFDRMGAFLLRGYNLTGTGYFDLVYVGKSSKTACLSENIDQGAKGLGLSGQVYVNPRWQQPLQPNQPIAYNIVLDVSGSMSYDFNGYGTYSGNDYMCESATNPNPLSLAHSDSCNGGKNAAWKTQSQRRVYVAKNAIYKFINNMGQYDMMRVVGFSTDQAGNAAPTPAWVVTSNQAAKDTLIAKVKCMGSYPASSTPPCSDTIAYKSSGGTPGPDALATAATMFQTSKGYTPTAGNGKPFRPVLIYLTDGVANVFQSSAVGSEDGVQNTARDICGAMSTNEAINTADPCQLGTTSSGKVRPITAMVNIANAMKANNPDLAIYTIGLGPVPATGLPRVASSPDMYFSATQGDVVQSILDVIQAEVTGATCASTGGYSWLDSIGGSHTPTGTPFSSLGTGVYGQVFIYEPGAGTPKYTLPINLDQSLSTDGRLGYSIAGGVTPGNYEMEAYVGYRGEDGVTRSYDWFINPSSLNEAHRIPVSVTSASTLGASVPMPPIFMDLRSTINVCPASP